MTRAFLRLVGLAFLGAALVPVVTVTCDRWSVHHAFSPGFLFELSGTALALAGTLGFYAVLRRYQSRVDANAREQADFLSAFPSQYADLAIFGAAALSLFLELAVIRWQGTVFEFFAFYKNFSLLCCFAGLGLGDRKSTRLNSSHVRISYAVFCLKKKKKYLHGASRLCTRPSGGVDTDA